jgi:hypothetical protein
LTEGERFPLMPPGELLSSAQLERVIQRAAELQTAREDIPDRLDDAEVMRIGEEVGLDSQHVHRALLELRAESMVPDVQSERSFQVRMWGVGHVQASRVVPGDVAEVQNRLGSYLKSGESLRSVRDRAGLSVWEPASDLGSLLKRSLDFGGHGFELAKARRVESMIQQLESGRSLVTLSADLTNERAEHATLWMAGTTIVGAGATVALVLAAGFPLLLVAPVAAAASLAGGSAAAASTFRTRRERVDLVMNGLLDRLERGGELPDNRPTIVEKISGFLDSVDNS